MRIVKFFFLCLPVFFSCCIAGIEDGDIEFRPDMSGRITFDVKVGDIVGVRSSLYQVTSAECQSIWQLSPYKAKVIEIACPHESQVTEGQLVLRMKIL